MNLSAVHNVFFIGIGGIGMSGLARYFKHLGKHVCGYDKTPSSITDSLQSEGISVYFQSNIRIFEELPKEETIIIYTPAVKMLPELDYAKANGYTLMKRSEVLGEITKNTYCLAVSGTHGKTTVTAILAHLLQYANADFTAFMGGISENYNTNVLINGSTYTVAEADEFDRSFLRLSPKVACVTAMDADHLDIYNNVSELRLAFEAFSKKVEPDHLFVRYGLPLKGNTFGMEQAADYHILDLITRQETSTFSIQTPTQRYSNIAFHYPGKHNLMNALVAFSMALKAGFPAEALIKGLATFKGVKRRFTFMIKRPDFVFIDDYAHHPVEIDAVYDAVRNIYPSKKITAIFQPHLYSRTRDFATEFAKSLSAFDSVWLLDLYPARELPIPGISSEWLLEKVANPNKKLLKKTELLGAIKASKPEVLVTIGAGDIAEEAEFLKANLI